MHHRHDQRRCCAAHRAAMRQDPCMGLLNFLVNLFVPDPRPEPTQAAAPADVDGSPRWAPPERSPERKGKRKTIEELEAERASLAAHMLELSQKRIARDFPRAQAAGITHYRWRSMGDSGGACPTCVSLEGKKFRLDQRPSHGHPGEALCGERGYCRCYPEMIVPGFD